MSEEKVPAPTVPTEPTMPTNLQEYLFDLTGYLHQKNRHRPHPYQPTQHSPRHLPRPRTRRLARLGPPPPRPRRNPSPAQPLRNRRALRTPNRPPRLAFAPRPLLRRRRPLYRRVFRRYPRPGRGHPHPLGRTQTPYPHAIPLPRRSVPLRPNQYPVGPDRHRPRRRPDDAHPRQPQVQSTASGL